MEKKNDDKRPFQSSIPISNGLPFGRAYRPTMLLNIPMHFDFVPREQCLLVCSSYCSRRGTSGWVPTSGQMRFLPEVIDLKGRSSSSFFLFF